MDPVILVMIEKLSDGNVRIREGARKGLEVLAGEFGVDWITIENIYHYPFLFLRSYQLNFHRCNRLLFFLTSFFYTILLPLRLYKFRILFLYINKCLYLLYISHFLPWFTLSHISFLTHTVSHLISRTSWLTQLLAILALLVWAIMLSKRYQQSNRLHGDHYHLAYNFSQIS